MRKIAYWLSLLLIFSMPWDTAIELPAFGTVSRILGILVAGFWIGTILVTKKLRKPHPFHLLFFLFVFWHLLSVYWTIDLSKTMTRLGTYAQLFIMVYLVWDLYLTPDSIRAGLQAFAWGAWITVGGMIYNFINNVRFTSIRYSAFGFDENNVGVILALAIPVAWYLGTYQYKSRVLNSLKIINILYVPAGLFSILLTGSRGALLAAMPGLLYALFTFQRLKPILRVFILIVIIVAAINLLPLVPSVLLHRLSTTGTQISEGNLNGRVDIWVAGFNALAKQPFIGIGSSAFTSATNLDKAAHNSYLVVLFELGLVGFIIFALIIAVTIYHIFGQPKDIRSFWVAVLLVLAIGIFSLNWAHRKQTWIFPILEIACACLPAEAVAPRKSEKLRVGIAPATNEIIAKKV